MLLDDDVVAQREAEPGAFARGFGLKERIEHLCLYFSRNAGSIVANDDLDARPQVARRSLHSRLVGSVGLALLALGRRVESVGNQVENDARDLLRIEIGRAGRGIER